MSTAHSTSNPLVTIAIPTFNRALWLKDCVVSALSQTYQHFEILVSDNASTDETEQVLSEFSDRRLRVLRQKSNIGLLPNWNACLAGARGDYVIFLSDDERLAPWMLERCINLVKVQPEIPIVITLSTLHSTDETWPARTSEYLDTGIWDGADILLEYLTYQISVHMCGIMMRTVVIRARGGFRLDFPHLADTALWAPLLLKGKAGLVNEACATCYSHGASETARLSVEQLLRDGWEVANLISNLAEHSVNDLKKRRRICLQSRVACLRRGLIILDLYRRQGGGLVEVLTVVWRFRHIFLSNVGMKNFHLGRWHIANIFCRRQIGWIRRFKRFCLNPPT